MVTKPVTDREHIRQPVTSQKNVIECQIHFAAVLLATLGLELLFLYALTRGVISLSGAALLHVLLLVLLFFWQQKLFRYPAGVMHRTVYLFLVSTAVFGLAGVLGTLLTIGLHAGYQRTTPRFEQWCVGLLPKEERERNEVNELVDFIEAHRYLEGAAVPDSFRDILDSGSLQQKRDAIILMTKHFCPEFSVPLRSALLDADNSIRVMAALSITRIENRSLEKAVQVDRSAANDPDNVDVLLQQARLYDDYAFTGLLEQDREEVNREKAKQIYRDIIKLQPENYPATLGLGRLLIRTKRVDEAAELLQKTLRFRNSEPQLMLWYAECLYRLKRYQELRELLREYGTDFVNGPGKQQPRIADVVLAWQGENAPLS